MALLEILEFPDTRLRQKARKVTQFGKPLEKITRDMLETMYAAHGIGLAATQVDIHQAIIVLDVSDEGDTPEIFINPEIIKTSKEKRDFEEGCLSVPGFREIVSRPDSVSIKAHRINGESYQRECEGLLAVCLQHEMDHLDGKLFVDYLSSLKRQRIKKRLEKTHRLKAG
jgi:peptide deformylase